MNCFALFPAFCKAVVNFSTYLEAPSEDVRNPLSLSVTLLMWGAKYSNTSLTLAIKSTIIGIATLKGATITVPTFFIIVNRVSKALPMPFIVSSPKARLSKSFTKPSVIFFRCSPVNSGKTFLNASPTVVKTLPRF